ncbi:MAG: ATP-binding protein [Deltaproteobacteria bacterium]|jgi:hypothetical protein|nr:ATP-binding protein [Deltaproteobacteria bacterium]
MSQENRKIFNTEGPCDPDLHYMVPAIDRQPAIEGLIEDKAYFSIHAPRQSGKTTLLNALTRKINMEGTYHALSCSLFQTNEANNLDQGTSYIVDLLSHSVAISPEPAISALRDKFPSLSRTPPILRVWKAISFLSISLEKELIIFFDEADSVPGSTIVSFLGQLREGFMNRISVDPKIFPRSIALVGLRDVRDYRTEIRPDGESRGTDSPFNVRKRPIGMPNFSKSDVIHLFNQHTETTGQKFKDSAIDKVIYWTNGQPWLVNVLASDIISGFLKNDYSFPIDGSLVDSAAINLLTIPEVHFLSLAQRLKEPRIKMAISTVISGSKAVALPSFHDDLEYSADLGILKFDDATDSYSFANPIYDAVIVKTLHTQLLDSDIPMPQNRWMDGKTLDMNGLFKAFQVYWYENAEILSEESELSKVIDDIIFEISNTVNFTDGDCKKNREDLKKSKNKVFNVINESFCVLVLCAFLQRVLNGVADIPPQRQFATGRKLIDICVTYKGYRYPIEVKIKRNISKEAAIQQLLGYILHCNVSEGWLIIFDRKPGKLLSEKSSFETVVRDGKRINIVNC